MNRLSKDMMGIDMMLASFLATFLAMVMQVSGTIISVGAILPWFLVAVSPMGESPTCKPHASELRFTARVCYCNSVRLLAGPVIVPPLPSRRQAHPVGHKLAYFLPFQRNSGWAVNHSCLCLHHSPFFPNPFLLLHWNCFVLYTTCDALAWI